MSDLTKSLLHPDEKKSSIKNIALLAIAWALTLTTSTLLTTIGPLSAVELGASDSLAAFTIGTFLVGAAVSSVPSARLFSKYGRFYGFSIGCLCQIFGSIAGAAAMGFRCLPIVFFGCFFVGLGQGLGQFYRFSAVEISTPDQKSKAITYVLSGGVIAAFLGPICADNTASLDNDHKFLGSYLVIALIGFMNEVTIYFVDFPRPVVSSESDVKNVVTATEPSHETPLHEQETLVTPEKFDAVKSPRERTALDIITQPLFMLSCFVATMAHTIMVMLMSDVTLAMDDYGYSLAATSLVMELHFFSMFGPGFFTGKLILAYGSFMIALFGAVIFGASSAVFLIDTELWNFYLGMILLGIGWNFSFSAGTVMLTDSYESHEATRVQAINDFILFTVAGIGSLAAGFVYAYFGWKVIVIVTLVMIIGNLVVFSIAARLKLHKTAADVDLKSSPSNRPSNSSWREYEYENDQNEHFKHDKLTFKNTFSFDGMDETNQMKTVRSFSAA